MALIRKIENIVWSMAVLLPVGLVSLGYVLFKRDFAKLHLEFSFLNFPIFVGEILLCYCVLLLIFWWIRNPPQWNPFYAFALVYLIWLAFKTLVGYGAWGPLALRHAALFYYPFFFLIGYVFFNREVFSKPVILSVFIVILGIFLWRNYDVYWTLTLALLGTILILGTKERKWMIPMALVLALSIPYIFLFRTSRMMLVANIFSFVFITAAGLYLLNIKTVIKVGVVVLLLAAVSFGVYRFFILGESGRVYTPPGEVIEQFRQMDKTVQKEKKPFKMYFLQVGLYNPGYNNSDSKYYYNPEGYFLKKEECSKLSVPKKQHFEDKELLECFRQRKHLHQETVQPPVVVVPPRKIIHGKPYEEWESIYNIVFRLMIWRDMWEEWKSQRPLGGFDFGRPLRSPSLEILRWAETEWGRDGWIEPHNSYFNILYRAGIVGIVLLALIGVTFIRFVSLAFKRRSWTLILLAAILLNWLVAANFLVILEFPYTAIPFWTLAGIACAYAYKNTVPSQGAYEIKR